MKKRVLVFWAVLVLFLLTAGSLYPSGWITNTANYPVEGGKFLVIRNGAGIEFKDNACLMITGSEPYCEDFYLSKDVPGSCTYKYPYLAPWGGIYIDMSEYLGWNDPDWWDGFNVCLATALPDPWP